MIQVHYAGRLGNQLFTYCFGRIIAEALGFELKAPPIEGFVGTYDKIGGKRYDAPVVSYTKRDLPDLEAIISDKSPRKIFISAWVQKYAYYEKYADKIRNDWLRIDPLPDGPEKDTIIVQIRLGDTVWQGLTLSPRYYIDCIEKYRGGIPHAKVYIVTEDPGSPLLNAFAKYDPIIIDKNAADSIRFMKTASAIVMSQSTFSWWGAFLSDAQKIYYPHTERSIWSKDSYAQLDVNESRYEYVENAPLLSKDPEYKDFDKEYELHYTIIRSHNNRVRLKDAPTGKHVRFVCFCDDPNLRSTTWQSIYVPSKELKKKTDEELLKMRSDFAKYSKKQKITAQYTLEKRPTLIGNIIKSIKRRLSYITSSFL